MKNLFSQLNKHGIVNSTKILLKRVSGDETRHFIKQIEVLNSREFRVHSYISEAISLLEIPSILETSLTGVKDGPLKGKFEKYGSDKETRHSYTEIYDEILGKFSNPKILEIGLGSINPYPYAGLPPGGSTFAFREAYPSANLIGCDIDPDSVLAIGGEGYVVDQTSEISLKSLVSKLEEKDHFDLIIDDGFHDIHANVRTLLHLYPRLSENGFFVIEDVHTSMLPLWRLFQPYLPGDLTFADMSSLRPSTDDNVLLIFKKRMNKDNLLG